MEPSAILREHIVDRARQWRHSLEVIEEVFGHRVTRRDDGDVISLSKKHGRLANSENHLDMDDVRLEILDDTTHFKLWRYADSKVLIKRKHRRPGAVDYVVAIYLFAFIAVLARCDHDNLVPTCGQTLRQVATKRCNSIVNRVVEIRRDENFHIGPLYHPTISAGYNKKYHEDTLRRTLSLARRTI